MELIVGSRGLRSEVIVALDVTGREHLVIVTKATWRVPEAGQRAQPIEPQPIEPSDRYVGEPGLSAMVYGSDLARFKPRCDVLFDAHAHSPDGLATTELTAAFQVGSLKKGLRAVGQRTWKRTMGVNRLTEPRPFLKMPLHYGMALGGTLSYEQGSGQSRKILADALSSNPSGLGWAGSNTTAQIDGSNAPCLEPLTDTIRRPDANQAPVAFSAIGRHWSPRCNFAGTYDDAWRTNVAPLLPSDFDERFHQCAPEDQQMDYPRGGEAVVLRNMLPSRGDVRFRLPRLDHLKLQVLRTDYSTVEPQPVVDTLFFELDAEGGARFSAVWRASLPIHRRLQEFDTVAIGPVNSQWWRDKVLGLGQGGCGGCGPSDNRMSGAGGNW